MARKKSITETGPVGLKGIRNTDLYNKLAAGAAAGNEDMQSILYSMSKGVARPFYNGQDNLAYIAPQVDTSPEAFEWRQLGESSYDQPFMFGSDPSFIQENRAQEQNGFVQVFNGIAKGVTTAATTFIDGTAGLIWGLGQGVYNAFNTDYSKEDGAWNKFWHGAGEVAEGLFNNDISNSMRSLNQYMEEVLPNYRTKDEIENPWALRNVFSVNTIADDFLKNLGFTVGAFYSGAAYLKALKGIGMLVEAGKMSDTAARTIGSIMNGLSEGRIEAGNLYDEQIKTEMGNLQSEYNDLYAQIDAMPDELIPLEGGGFYSPKEKAKLELAERFKKASADIEERASDAAIANMIGNTLYLSASEFWTFGKLYGGKFNERAKLKDKVKPTGPKALDIVAEEAEKAETIGSRVTRNAKGLYETVKESPGKAVRAGLTTGLLEGAEEMDQSFMASSFGNMYTPDSPDAYYKALTEDEYTTRTKDFMESIKEGFTESWGNSDTYKEGAIGFLTGILGMPSFGRINNSNDQTYIGKGKMFGISGGIFGELARSRKLNEDASHQVTAMNKFVTKMGNIKDSFTRMTAFQDSMDGYSAEKNQFEYQNASDNDMFNGIDAFARTGRLQDLKDMVSEDFENLSDERLADIAQNANSTTKEWTNGDGTLMSDTEEGRTKMRKELADRRDSILSAVEQYEESLENVRYIAGNSLTDDQTRELAWLDFKGKQFTKRYEDIKKETSSFVQSLKNTINAFKKGRGRGFIDENTEEGKKIANQIETFGDLLDAISDSDISPLALGHILNANKPLLDLLADNESILRWSDILEDLSGIDHDTFDHSIKQLLDAAKIGQASVQFNERFKEFTRNPAKLIGNREKIEKQAAKTAETKRGNDILNNVDNATVQQLVQSIDEGTLPPDIMDIIEGEDPSDINDTRRNKLEEAQKIVEKVDRMEQNLQRMLSDPTIDQQAVADAQALLAKAKEVADKVDQLTNMSSEVYNNGDNIISEADAEAAMAAAQSAEEAGNMLNAQAEQRLANAQTLLNRAATDIEGENKVLEGLPQQSGQQGPQRRQATEGQGETGHDSVAQTPAVGESNTSQQPQSQEPTQYMQEAEEYLRNTGTPIQPTEFTSTVKALGEMYSLIDRMVKQGDDPRVIASAVQALPSYRVLEHNLRPDTIQRLVNERYQKTKASLTNPQTTGQGPASNQRQDEQQDSERIVTPSIAQETIAAQIEAEFQRNFNTQSSGPLNYWKPTLSRYPRPRAKGDFTPIVTWNDQEKKYVINIPRTFTPQQSRRIIAVFNFLQRNGAFDNVDNGVVSVQSTSNRPKITFFSQKSVNEEAGEIVIFMMDSAGRVLGDLGSKNDPGTARQTGLIEFINKAEEEYNRRIAENPSEDFISLSPMSFETTVLQNMVGKVPYTATEDRRTLNVIWDGKPFTLAIARTSGANAEMFTSNRTLSSGPSRLDNLIMSPLNAVAGQPYVLVETSDPTRKRKYVPVPFNMPPLNASTANSGLAKIIRSVFDAIPNGDWKAIKNPLTELLGVKSVHVNYSKDGRSVNIYIVKQDGKKIYIYSGSKDWEGAANKAFQALVNQGDIPFQISRKYINREIREGVSYNGLIGELAQANLPVGGTHTVDDWFTINPVGSKGSIVPSTRKNPNANQGQPRPTGQSINYRGVDYIVTPGEWKVYKDDNGQSIEVTGETAVHVIARVQVAYNGNDITKPGPYQTTVGWYNPVTDKIVTAPKQEETSVKPAQLNQQETVSTQQTNAQQTELLDKVRDSLDTEEKEEIWNKLSVEQQQQVADMSAQRRDQFFEEVSDIYDEGEFTEDVTEFLPGGARYSKVEERKTSKEWNEKKEKAWLRKALPQLSGKDRLVIHEGLIELANGKRAYGMFRQGIITIANNAANGTLYHEAFHAVTWTLLTEKERGELFETAQRVYGMNSAIRLEEKMAEDFRIYIQSEQRPLIGRLTRVFRTLKHRVKALFGKETYIDKVFYNISRRKYADRDIKESNVTRFDINSREREAIKQQAIANGTFMLAPNGKPTNLTEDQWITVRTKNFKDWFGDWEKVARSNKYDSRGLSYTGATYNGVTVTSQKFDPDMAPDGGTRMIFIGDEYIGEFPTVETSDKIRLAGSLGSATSIIEKYRGKGYGKKAYIALANIAKAEGKVLYSDSSMTDDAVRLWESLVKQGLAEQVKENKGKLGGGVFNFVQYRIINEALPKADSIDKIDDNVSKVIDENGEPLVVYHTGASGITSFRTEVYDENDIPTGIPNAIYTTDSHMASTSYNHTESLLNDWWENEATLEDSHEQERESVKEAMLLFFDGLLTKNFTNEDDFWREYIKIHKNSSDFDKWFLYESYLTYKNLAKDFEKFLAKKEYDSKDNWLNSRLAEEFSEEMFPYPEEPDFYSQFNTYSLFVRMINPKIIDAREKSWNNINYNGKKVSTRDLEHEFEQSEYDGIIVRNVFDYGGATLPEKPSAHTVFISYSNTYVKSATDNIGTFDSNNPDIRYRMVEEYDTAVEETNRTIEDLEEALKNKWRTEFVAQSGDAFKAVTHWTTQKIKGENRKFGQIGGVFESRYAAEASIPNNIKKVVYITQSSDGWRVMYNKDQARNVFRESLSGLQTQLSEAKERLTELKSIDREQIVSDQALADQERYRLVENSENDMSDIEQSERTIEQYHRDKFEYGNLAPEQIEYLEQRGISVEEYNRMSQLERETLFKCMV